MNGMVRSGERRGKEGTGERSVERRGKKSSGEMRVEWRRLVRGVEW